MRPERYDRVATLLLVAALAAPLASNALGLRLSRPFGLSQGGLVLLLASVLAAHAAIAASRRDWRRIALEALLFMALAVPMALLIRSRTNAFYTSVALLEGLSILLAAQLVARALRRFALMRRRIASGAVWPAALAAADRVVAGSLVAILAMFLFAWAGFREAAGISLIAATALELLVMLLRLPDSVRGLGTALATSPRRAGVNYRLMLRRVRRARSRRPGRRPRRDPVSERT